MHSGSEVLGLCGCPQKCTLCRSVTGLLLHGSLLPPPPHSGGGQEKLEGVRHKLIGGGLLGGKKFLQLLSFVFSPYTEFGYWIGIRTSVGYFWDDGTPLASDPWFPWADGTEERCVWLQYNNGQHRFWRSSCEVSFPFLCQFEYGSGEVTHS